MTLSARIEEMLKRPCMLYTVCLAALDGKHHHKAATTHASAMQQTMAEYGVDASYPGGLGSFVRPHLHVYQN